MSSIGGEYIWNDLLHNKSFRKYENKDFERILLTFVSTSGFLTDCIKFSCVVVPLASSYQQEHEQLLKGVVTPSAIHNHTIVLAIHSFNEI